VIAPPSQPGPLPMLMVLHGRLMSPATTATQTGFVSLAQQGKAVLVYPAGYQRSWNAGGCCGHAAAAHINDTAFLAAVVANVMRHYSIDSTRVYLVGFSNGGRMAFTEVCAQPTLFAAFATYAAVPTQTCQHAQTPVPALISSGTADPLLAGMNPHRSATDEINAAVATWRSRDGCSAASTSSTVPPARLTTWSDCRGGSAVREVLYPGLEHSWPRATHVHGLANTAVGSAAAGATVMWSFLATRHSPPRA
jgi:polyhydroxybutyrate depolymerase